MQLYLSGVGALIGLLYLLALAFLWRLLPAGVGVRLATTACAAVIGMAVLFWDVVITSAQMHALCPTAGIDLKRSVRADGYLASVGGVDVLKLGFKYVEVRTGSLVRVYEKVDGEFRKKVIDTKAEAYVLRSRYEFVSGENKPRAGLANISTKRSEVRDRLSGEVLGTATTYTAYPGWVDRNTVALIGKVMWVCPAEQLQSIRMLRMTVLPNP